MSSQLELAAANAPTTSDHERGFRRRSNRPARQTCNIFKDFFDIFVFNSCYMYITDHLEEIVVDSLLRVLNGL